MSNRDLTFGTIPDAVVRDCVQHHDDRGWLMEIIRADDPEFMGFGQVYVTTTYQGVVKGFHMHEEQWDYVTCVAGMIKLVMIDIRGKTVSAFGELHGATIQEVVMGERNSKLVIIPPGVLHGWKSLDGTAVVVNVPNKMYDYAEPDEQRREPHSLEYDWNDTDR